MKPLFILFSLVAFSCTRYTPGIEATLSLAGSNNINVSKRATALSMKNIEALALGEGGSGYNNAKSIYCVMPASKIGCISQVARQCYESVFCTH